MDTDLMENDTSNKSLTKITNQLPLLATYRVFTVHKSHYMCRLYGHSQVYLVYKNTKIIIKT
jgi:hypothetical protein